MAKTVKSTTSTKKAKSTPTNVFQDNKTCLTDNGLGHILKKNQTRTKGGVYVSPASSQRRGAKPGEDQRPVLVLNYRATKTGSEQIRVFLKDAHLRGTVEATGYKMIKIGNAKSSKTLVVKIHKNFWVSQDIDGNAFLMFEDRKVGEKGVRAGNTVSKVSGRKLDAWADITSLARFCANLVPGFTKPTKAGKEIIYTIGKELVEFKPAITNEITQEADITCQGYALTEITLDEYHAMPTKTATIEIEDLIDSVQEAEETVLDEKEPLINEEEIDEDEDEDDDDTF